MFLSSNGIPSNSTIDKILKSWDSQNAWTVKNNKETLPIKET